MTNFWCLAGSWP